MYVSQTCDLFVNQCHAEENLGFGFKNLYSCLFCVSKKMFIIADSLNFCLCDNNDVIFWCLLFAVIIFYLEFDRVSRLRPGQGSNQVSDRSRRSSELFSRTSYICIEIWLMKSTWMNSEGCLSIRQLTFCALDGGLMTREVEWSWIGISSRIRKPIIK